MIEALLEKWDQIIVISPITIVVLILVLFTLAELRFRYAMDNWRQGEKVLASLDFLVALLFTIACLFYFLILVW